MQWRSVKCEEKGSLKREAKTAKTEEYDSDSGTGEMQPKVKMSVDPSFPFCLFLARQIRPSSSTTRHPRWPDSSLHPQANATYPTPSRTPRPSTVPFPCQSLNRTTRPCRTIHPDRIGLSSRPTRYLPDRMKTNWAVVVNNHRQLLVPTPPTDKRQIRRTPWFT